MTVGADHDDTPSLPAVEPLAVPTTGPGVGLREVTLAAQAIALIHRGALAIHEGQHRDVLGSVAVRAHGAGPLRVYRLDVFVSVADALFDHDHLPTGVAGRARILTHSR